MVDTTFVARSVPAIAAEWLNEVNQVVHGILGGPNNLAELWVTLGAAVDISGGTIEGTIIGGTTPAVGTFSVLTISSNLPQKVFIELAGSADNKRWDWTVSGEIFKGRAVNDANTVASDWVLVNRTGTTIDSIEFPNGEVGIGITPISGVQLLLPSENDSATPTLAFGNGDTGFYEAADNNLRVAINGASRYIFRSDYFSPDVGYGASLFWRTPTATNPGFTFTSDDNTGIGRAGPDLLSLIAGGAEAIRIDKSVTAGNTRFFVWDVDNNALERVTVGIADSGGTNFKLLRIAN